MRLIRTTTRPRGFALIAAIGVLAVIAIVALAAAGSTEFTHNYVGMDFRDGRLRHAIATQARMLSKRDLSGGPSATDNDIKLVVTLGEADLKALAGDTLAMREGDIVATITARFQDGRDAARTSTYLVNTKGLRSSPILLSESISAEAAKQ